MSEPSDALSAIQAAAHRYSTLLAADPNASPHTALADTPVPARLLLAAVILAAADRPLSILNLCDTAGVSRVSAYNHHKTQMATIRDTIPPLVRAHLRRASDPPQTAELYEQIRDREASIQRLRTEISQLRAEHSAALGYARDLHERLRVEVEANQAEARSKVRPLRSVPAPEHDEPPEPWETEQARQDAENEAKFDHDTLRSRTPREDTSPLMET